MKDRARARELAAEFHRKGGLLLVIARGREPSDPEGQMPWPLTRAELSAFTTAGLQEISFEDLLDFEDPAEPAVRRFRALYQRRSRQIEPSPDWYHLSIVFLSPRI